MVCWAYNEEELIEEFLHRASELMNSSVNDYEIILVDDCSTDKTNEIAQNFRKENPRLKIFRNERNLNVGGACRRAISLASKEFTFWQTVDWSYDLKNLRIFLELLRHFDVIQGIRPTPIRLLSHIPVVRSIYRVKTRSDNLSKAFVSLGNYYLLRILFGIQFHDFQNVTIYPTKLLQSFELTGKGAFISPECLFKAYMRGARFLEVPIPFIPRKIGEASGTKLPFILRSVADILINWVKWGWRLRLARWKGTETRLFHVEEPMLLDEEVLRLVVPLFKEYQPKSK